MRDVEQFTRLFWPHGGDWRLDGDDLVFAGTDLDYVSKLYDPMTYGELFSDFADIGRRAEIGEPDIARRVRQFVKRYGPLVAETVEGMPRHRGGRYVFRMAIADVVVEARALHHAQETADLLATNQLNDQNRAMTHERRQLQEIVRQRLEDVRLGLDERLKLHQTCPDLLTALWLQFAQAVDGGGPWRRCKNPACARLFAVSGRRDREYHTSACRNRAGVNKSRGG